MVRPPSHLPFVETTGDKLSYGRPQEVNILSYFFVLVLVGLAPFQVGSNINNRTPLEQASTSQPKSKGIVLGASINNQDSNHPEEIYWGRSDKRSLDSMIEQLGVVVYPEDRVSSFPEPGMGLGSRIKIERAMPVAVIDGATEKTFRTWQKDVKEVLDEANIVLGEKDIVNPGLETPLAKNLAITIVRVAETEFREAITLPFKTITKDDPELEKGKTKVIKEGENGKREKIYRIRRENGAEVEKTLISDTVLKEPVDKVLAKGTKVTVYGTGVASFYTYSDEMIAANNFLPRGTKVKVTNLSNGKSVVVTIAGGGLRSDRIIDLSTGAFQALGASLGQGLIRQVRLEKVE